MPFTHSLFLRAKAVLNRVSIYQCHPNTKYQAFELSVSISDTSITSPQHQSVLQGQYIKKKKKKKGLILAFLRIQIPLECDFRQQGLITTSLRALLSRCSKVEF